MKHFILDLKEHFVSTENNETDSPLPVWVKPPKIYICFPLNLNYFPVRLPGWKPFLRAAPEMKQMHPLLYLPDSQWEIGQESLKTAQPDSGGKAVSDACTIGRKQNFRWLGQIMGSLLEQEFATEPRAPDWAHSQHSWEDGDDVGLDWKMRRSQCHLHFLPLPQWHNIPQETSLNVVH